MQFFYYMTITCKQLNNNIDESKITGDTKTEALEEFTKEGYSCVDSK